MNSRPLLLIFGVALAGILAGCSLFGPQDYDRVVFPDATVNGQPARLVMDTGSSLAELIDTPDHRLSVKIALPVAQSFMKLPDQTTPRALSEPVRVTAGGETFTTPLAIMEWPHSRLDGFIGWLVIQDNILVFDAANHTVTSVPELPAVTSGWLKLKIISGVGLLLETPLPDGIMGEIAVDTGSDAGVALPQTQWQVWKKAHPHTHISTKAFKMPATETGMSYIHDEQALADEVALGPLTLTHVWVQGASSSESNLADNYIGTLGFGALEHLDMVVDGKNGFAYLRPIPPITAADTTQAEARNTSTNPSRRSGDWVVVGHLNLKIDSLLTISGWAKAMNDDYDGALADLNRALEINPKNADAYLNRGDLKRVKSDYDGALTDLNHALELNPKDAAAYFDRGEIKRLKSDFAGALDDLNHAIKLDPKNALAFFSRGAAKSAQGDFDGALADLNQALILDPKNVEAHYYRGYVKMENGDLVGAITDFNQALALDPKDAEAYSYRGTAKALNRDYDGAIADFDHALELDPKNVNALATRPQVYRALLSRAGDRQISGDFAGALADYDQYLVSKPDNSIYPCLNRQVLQHRLGKTSADFKDTITGWKDGWTKSIGQYLLGNLNETDLLTAAEKQDQEAVDSQKCEAFYFIGLLHLIKGDQDGAYDFFTQAVATRRYSNLEYRFARAELTRLDAAGQ